MATFKYSVIMYISIKLECTPILGLEIKIYGFSICCHAPTAFYKSSTKVNFELM